MTQQLVLVRGIPGSGKTTIAKCLSKACGHGHIETDMFFTNPLTGEYIFEGNKVAKYHKKCQQYAEEMLEAGLDVVVSNTFTQHWEMEPYKRMAKKHNAELIILCTNNVVHANTHNVPEHTIKQMYERWED